MVLKWAFQLVWQPACKRVVFSLLYRSSVRLANLSGVSSATLPGMKVLTAKNTRKETSCCVTGPTKSNTGRGMPRSVQNARWAALLWLAGSDFEPFKFVFKVNICRFCSVLEREFTLAVQIVVNDLLGGKKETNHNNRSDVLPACSCTDSAESLHVKETWKSKVGALMYT